MLIVMYSLGMISVGIGIGLPSEHGAVRRTRTNAVNAHLFIEFTPLSSVKRLPPYHVLNGVTRPNLEELILDIARRSAFQGVGRVLKGELREMGFSDEEISRAIARLKRRYRVVVVGEVVKISPLP